MDFRYPMSAVQVCVGQECRGGVVGSSKKMLQWKKEDNAMLILLRIRCIDRLEELSYIYIYVCVMGFVSINSFPTAIGICNCTEQL